MNRKQVAIDLFKKIITDLNVCPDGLSISLNTDRLLQDFIDTIIDETIEIVEERHDL